MSTSDEQLMLEVKDGSIPRVFFAYPSEPYVQAETVKEAAAKIKQTHVVNVSTWEDMSIPGKCLMSEICREINQADVFCADITTLNPNVMFELGYAIARDKRIWPLLDKSLTESRKLFDQFELLTTTGYAPYTNSEEILSAFLRDRPYLDLGNTIFRQTIKPTLSSRESQIILYLRSRHDTNASIRISGALKHCDVPQIVDDPTETGVQPLSWYGQQCYAALGVVAHLLSLTREGSQIVNAKYALVSGLAYGFDRKVLMLAEPEYIAPLDYRELLYNYKTAKHAENYLKQWLAPIENLYRESISPRDRYRDKLHLEVELREFYVKIGEYLAENEAIKLAEYYVETTAYQEALAGTRNLFIGRKGTGKTANMVSLSSELKKDPHNVVCVVQPVGYEIESLVRLFSLYRQRDTKGYVIESLWKFILLTEIANATVEQIESRPPWVHLEADEKHLIELLQMDRAILSGDFAVRLERCVSSLLQVPQSTSVEQQRKGISEGLHENLLKTLRTTLANVLSKRKRAAILIDNLDKAWIKEADITQLAPFLIGLFVAANRLSNDFARQDSRRKHVYCTAAIFVRSDIFNKVIESAREPDKLAVTKLAWNDQEMLSLVVEKRFSSAHPEASSGADLWTRYFCALVKQKPARDYILSRILPRPRDVVYFVKNAVSIAVNRGHTRVEEDDVVRAEKDYSKYALDSILVENSLSLPQLENVLYEFVGAPVILNEQQVRAFLSRAHIPVEKHDAVTSHLIELSFLGMEVERDSFVYLDEPRDVKKNSVLANRLSERENRRRYQVHAAFRAYLEMDEGAG